MDASEKFFFEDRLRREAITAAKEIFDCIAILMDREVIENIKSLDLKDASLSRDLRFIFEISDDSDLLQRLSRLATEINQSFLADKIAEDLQLYLGDHIDGAMKACERYAALLASLEKIDLETNVASDGELPVRDGNVVRKTIGSQRASYGTKSFQLTEDYKRCMTENAGTHFEWLCKVALISEFTNQFLQTVSRFTTLINLGKK